MIDACPGRDPLPDHVEELAVDTLTEWVDGYTMPATGPQLRVRVMQSSRTGLVVGVETCDPYPSGDLRLFEITVSVKEVWE